MKILILGAGALGSNLAAYLSADIRDEHQITVLDCDAVEERNMRAGTQFYLPEQTGLPKVEALQYNIYNEYKRQIQTIIYKVTKENNLIFGRHDLVIDCFDNFEARSVTTRACKDIPCVHMGFGKYTWSILWNEGYQPPETMTNFDLCELPGASSFVHMVAAIGSSVIQEYLKTGKKREFTGNRFSIREVI